MLAAGGDEVSLSDEKFIDDETNFEDQAPSDYALTNFTCDLTDAMRDGQEMAKELGLIDPDPQNFVSDSIDETEFEYDEFKDFEKRIINIEQGLKIYKLDSKDYLFYAVFYGIYYSRLVEKENFEFCQDKEKLVEVFGRDFFDKLQVKKGQLQLDLSVSTFEVIRHVVNGLLMTKKRFLRGYELRKKFRYLIKKMPKGKNVVQRDLLACFEVHFNGFELVRKLSENETRKLFKPTDVVYRPVSKINQILDCYFSKSTRNAYRVVSVRKNGQIAPIAD